MLYSELMSILTTAGVASWNTSLGRGVSVIYCSFSAWFMGLAKAIVSFGT
jgi:hypothetical protein